SYAEGQAYKTAAAQASQTREVVDWTQSLVSLLKDAETGQRGYLLTGDGRYLAPYTASLPKIAAELGRLRTLKPAHPADAQELANLVGTSLDELAESIRVRESGGAEAAIAIVQSDHGRATMDKIRALSASVIAGENAQLATLEASASLHGYETRFVVMAGAIV